MVKEWSHVRCALPNQEKFVPMATEFRRWDLDTVVLWDFVGCRGTFHWGFPVEIPDPSGIYIQDLHVFSILGIHIPDLLGLTSWTPSIHRCWLLFWKGKVGGSAINWVACTYSPYFSCQTGEDKLVPVGAGQLTFIPTILPSALSALPSRNLVWRWSALKGTNWSSRPVT